MTPKKAKPKTKFSKTRALVRKGLKETLEQEKMEKKALEEGAKEIKRLEYDKQLSVAQKNNKITDIEELHGEEILL